MKNLLIHINPSKQFSPEYETLTKIQIDNSLALGWKEVDILLTTNFEYEYQGVKSIIINDYEYFDQNRSTKIQAINQLFKDGVIEDDLYWFHDHDAFQMEPIEVVLNKDAGFTDHGAWSKTWNAGSFFFKKSARGIFLWIWEYMNKRHTNEQDALTFMWQNNINDINDRYELMSPAYNIGIYRIEENLRLAGETPKVAHFHPHKRRHLELFREMLPERLMKIFNEYGILGFDQVLKDFQSIKNRNYRKIWEPFMRKYRCDYVCEMGVYKGDNFVEMIAHNPKVAVAVDSWMDDGMPTRNTGNFTQDELDRQYEDFKKLMSDKPFVQIIRDYSENAARKFPDNYFDFVYIDADHSYNACYSDLINWYPKVKRGKFLVGHDYRRGFGVVEAVNKFIKDNGLELMFLSHSTWAVIKR